MNDTSNSINKFLNLTNLHLLWQLFLKSSTRSKKDVPLLPLSSYLGVKQWQKQGLQGGLDVHVPRPIGCIWFFTYTRVPWQGSTLIILFVEMLKFSKITIIIINQKSRILWRRRGESILEESGIFWFFLTWNLHN